MMVVVLGYAYVMATAFNDIIKQRQQRRGCNKRRSRFLVAFIKLIYII